MGSQANYRPGLLKPDYGSAYNELSGVSTPGGKMQGDGLVVYTWREGDMLSGTTFDHTLSLIESELSQVIAGTRHPGSLGVVFRFDITEPGTTTYGDVYIDLSDFYTRQALFNLRSKQVRESKMTSVQDLVSQLAWMPANFHTRGQADLAQVSLVTFKRFDDNYNG